MARREIGPRGRRTSSTMDIWFGARTCPGSPAEQDGDSAMENETMDLEQLASYLHRDVREVSKMASRGYLPGQKVGGQWRFASAEINYWIETQMTTYSEAELEALEAGTSTDQLESKPLVSALLSESTMAVPL